MRVVVDLRRCQGCEVDEPGERHPVPVGLPDPRIRDAYDATVVVTGHDPSERRAELVYHDR